jgi:hypothetical protein
MGPHRVNIINLLNLIASRSEQLEYQESAPVNVANEMVNQWFDDFYHPADEQFASQLSADELVLLKRFDAYYNERLALLPDSLDGLLRNRAWDEVVAYVGCVLDACRWRGIEAHYDRKANFGQCRTIKNSLAVIMTSNKRQLSEIAKEVRSDWKNITNSAAEEALSCMEKMGDIDFPYEHDSNGHSIVGTFLSNSIGWKGDVARRIKAELRSMSGSR